MQRNTCCFVAGGPSRVTLGRFNLETTTEMWSVRLWPTNGIPSMTQTEACSSGRPGAKSFRLGSSGQNLQGNTLVYPLLRGPDPKTPAPAGGCGGRCKEGSPRGARGTGVLCSQGLAPEAGGCKWGNGSRPQGLLSGWVKRGDGDGGEGRWQNWPAIHTPSHRNVVLTWVSWTIPF